MALERRDAIDLMMAGAIPEPTHCDRDVPAELRAALGDSLTATGVEQWWHGRSRYLKGRRSCEAWETHRDLVLQAVDAFTSGAYL